MVRVKDYSQLSGLGNEKGIFALVTGYTISGFRRINPGMLLLAPLVGLTDEEINTKSK